MIAATGLVQMCPAPNMNSALHDAFRVGSSITEKILANAMFDIGDAPYLPPGVPRSALDKCRKEVTDQKAQNRPVKMKNVEGVNDSEYLGARECQGTHR